jgi:hypothetical protein
VVQHGARPAAMASHLALTGSLGLQATALKALTSGGAAW